MNDSFNKLIEQDDPPIEEILTNPRFTSKLRLLDSNMKNFLINHFTKIYKYIFETEKVPGSAYNAFYMILVNLKTEVRNEIYEKTDFVDFCINFPKKLKNYSVSKQAIYFNVIQYVLQNDNFEVNPLFIKSNFFPLLLEQCDKETACDYISNLIQTQGQRLFSILLDVNFFDIICKNIIGTSKLNLNSQRLLLVCLDNGLGSSIAASLTKDNLIDQFLDFSINTRNRQCLNLLYSIQSNAMSNNRNSDWKSIEAAITLRRSDFVNIILTSDKFTEPVNTSLVIFSKMLFYGRSMGSDVPKVVSKLSKDFFRFQSNSFLHNSVLALFQLFERKRFLTEELAKDFIDGLIEAFDTKHEQKYTCSYWGQAREIFDAVYPYVKQSEKTEKIESIKKIFDKEEKTIEEVTPIKISQKKPRRNVPTRFQKSLQINTHQQSVSKVTLFVLFLMTLLMAILFVRKITNLSIGE